MIVNGRRFLKNTKISGITLYPFIVLRNLEHSNDQVLVNHEKIHLRQQLELLILPFYTWYLLEYLIRWASLRNRELAYRSISFEREAYENESNLNYITNRKFWAFLKYL